MTQLPTDLHITYQLQYRKCGKSACSTCRVGTGHGPYWYAYWREGTRLRSGYIGKIHIEEEVKAELTAQLSDDLLAANALLGAPTPTIPQAQKIVKPRKTAAKSRTTLKVKEFVLSS